MQLAIGLSVALVVLSNCLTTFVYVTGVNRELVYFAWAIVVVVVVVWWARHSPRLGCGELGLCGKQWKNSALIGILVGCLLAIPSVAFLVFPFVLANPAHYPEIQDQSLLGLLWRLGAELTIATAFTEEILFRGILQALFKRSLKPTRALMATNLVFALWHLAVNALTLQQNAVELPFIPTVLAQAFGYLASLLAVGTGGFILSIVRERTNHLAGSIVAHWVSVAAVTILVYVK